MFGIKIKNISLDFKKNVDRSRVVAKQLSKGIEFLMKKNGITHLTGFGKLESENNISVLKEGSKSIYQQRI